MQELNEQDLSDYGNHFNVLVSMMRLEMNIDEYHLEMPHVYLKGKYPARYQKATYYPPSFESKKLQTVIDYYNRAVKKTQQLLQRILTIVGEIIYGDSSNFVRALGG